LFIVGFKSAATKRINALWGTPSAPVWQRNYYEHIIRDEKSLNRIRQYIAENPLRWLDTTGKTTTQIAEEVMRQLGK
jgi:REP element-mobilizing transposase RayT